MAATDSWEDAAFNPESQAVFAQAGAQPVRPELGFGGPGMTQTGNAGLPPQEMQPKPYERMLQCWELEFQEFLEAEDFPWEDSHLQDWLAPWENPEAFLTSFQQVALACRWPQKEWVAQLLPSLNEDAAKAVRSLEDKDQGDFRKVKTAILQREAMNRERKRQQFRRFCYQEANGPREVCLRLQQLCHQWLKAERQTKEQILEQLVLEQFLNILPKEMKTWVRECGPVTCNRAVTLAEDFLRKLLAAESQGGQHLQELDDPAVNYSKTKASPPDRELLWAKKISVDPSSSKRSYTSYNQAREGRRKCPDWERPERAEHWSKSRGRASRASPYQTRREGVVVKEPRRSERLKALYPACRPDPSPPWEEARRKFRQTSLPPEHPQDRKKTCPECGQTFSGVSSLTRHRARHTGEKRYECCFCGQGFCWRSDLARHEYVHTGKKPHECQFCGEGFDRKWQRERHELGHVKVGRRL